MRFTCIKEEEELEEKKNFTACVLLMNFKIEKRNKKHYKMKIKFIIL